MRNVFDQYEQQENKLTHALMVTLANDKKLVRPFLKFVGVKRVPALKNIELGLQRVPGQELDLRTTKRLLAAWMRLGSTTMP